MPYRFVVFILFSAVLSSTSGQTFFGYSSTSDPEDEDLKGKPQSVRLEREVLRDEKGKSVEGKKYLEQETRFRPDGKVTEHRVYRPDGALSVREVTEYDDQARRTKTTSFDDKEKPVRIQVFRWIEPGTEEEIARDAGGKQLDTTLRKFDDHGRMSEFTSLDSDRIVAQMTMRYDEQGRPVEATVSFKGGDGTIVAQDGQGTVRPLYGESAVAMRLVVLYQSDKQAVITMYGPDGQIANQVQSTEDDAGRQMQQVLFQSENAPQKSASEQVDSTDAQGNWTRKTIFERNARTQVDEPAAVFYRTISYF
ncbi:MAG: hypothetical protein JWO48_1048 [Bryobacterales bacterium]|nr:hypothetical protein [Bryobacterales bacterium]